MVVGGSVIYPSRFKKGDRKGLEEVRVIQDILNGGFMNKGKEVIVTGPE